MNKRHWINDAIKRPGTLDTAAKRKGETTAGFAEDHEKDSGKSGQRARLAETLMKLRKR